MANRSADEGLLEAAKMLADDLHHYRSRETTVVVSFATFCLFFANALFSFQGRLDPLLGWSALLSLGILTFWIWRVLQITRQRGLAAKRARNKILLTLALPIEAKETLSLEPTKFFGITSVFGLIVLFIAIFPGVLLVEKMQ